MATVVSSYDDREVSVGRMIGRAFGTIIGNPLVTLLIALLFGAIPSTALTFLSPAAVAAADSDNPNSILGVAGFSVLIWAASLVVAAITQGVLTRATVAHSQRRKAGLGESIGAGVRVLLPLIVLALIIAIASSAALLLLIVPGVILYCMWSVAVPALIEERQGIGAALGRSRDLTRGHRWKVFGTLLVMAIIFWVFLGAAAALGVATSALGDAESFSLSVLLWNLGYNTLSTLVWSTIQASMYVELRNAKEGPDSERLRDVFA